MSHIISNRQQRRTQLAEEANTMRRFFQPLPREERNTLVRQYVQRANPGSVRPKQVLKEAAALRDLAQQITTRTNWNTLPREQQEELSSITEQHRADAKELEQWARAQLLEDWVINVTPSFPYPAHLN